MAAIGLINANLEKVAINLQERAKKLKEQDNMQRGQENNRIIPVGKQRKIKKTSGWVNKWR